MNNKKLLKSRGISDFDVLRAVAGPQYLVVGSSGLKLHVSCHIVELG